MGKKNYMFLGSECGGEPVAIFYTLIGSCRVNNINHFEYLKDILTTILASPTPNFTDCSIIIGE